MKTKLTQPLLILYAASTFISVAAMSIGYGILIVCALLLYEREGWITHLRRPVIKKYLFWTLAMIGIFLISITHQKLSPFAVFGVFPDVQYWGENKKFFYLLNPVILSYILLKQDDVSISRFVSYHWIALLAISILGLFQFFTSLPPTSPTPPLIPGVTTYLTNLGLGLTHSVTSNISMAVFPLMGAVLLNSAVFKNLFKNGILKTRAAWVITSFLAIFVICMTFARSAWATVPVGVMTLLLLGLPQKKAIKFILGLSVLGILILQVPFVKERLTSSGGYRDRFALWNGNIELFKQRPFFGVGWRQSSKLVDGAVRYHYVEKQDLPIPTEYFHSHAHNNFLEILSTTGACGLIAFLAWIIFVLRLAWNRRNNEKWGWWINGWLSGFFVILLNGLLQVNFWDSKVLHQIMLQVGILVAIIIRVSTDEKLPESNSQDT